MDKPGLYILRGRQVVRVCDEREWIQWIRGADLTIARDELRVAGDEVVILTRFLGMDHKLYAHGEGFALPLIFETGIFGLHEHIPRHRYSSYAEALAGHADLVARVSGERRAANVGA